MRHLIIALPVAGLAVLACAKNESSSDSTKSAAAKNAADNNGAKLGEAGGMKTPESVRYDPELDVFYVSNINGNPSQHDGNGFIAVVRADSTGLPLKKLVEGGKNG